MFKYLIRKVAGWFVTIFIATNLTYFLASAFLDPRSNYAERRPPIPPEQIDATLTRLNLNDKVPIFERWWIWLKGILLHWDWGKSPVGDPVAHQISYRIWVSAELILGATILTTVIGVALGVLTASRQYKFVDRFFQGLSIFTMNIHIIVAAMLVVLGAIYLNENVFHARVFYVTGAFNPDVTGGFNKFVDVLQHLALPTTAMVITGYAGYHFMQRSLLLDNINADYVRTARAKGLTRHQAIRRHALRTSIIPVATSVAFAVPGLFTGAVMTETIFGWQGMGQYFVQTIQKNDINGAVAIAAFAALMTAIGAILADLVVVALDPRVRVS